jgi:hypothetical protein
VLEQVRRFSETGYGLDAATEAEADFEQALHVQRGGFVLSPKYLDSAPNFLALLQFVGGPKLLHQHGKKCTNATASIATSESASSSGFRGDRRLIRLVIARCFVDRAILQFERSKAQAEEAGGASAKE